jgi:GNAT superfamily N-acetyltransferase
MREDRVAPPRRAAAGRARDGVWVAHAPDDIARARTLFVEYARGLGVDLCFQGFDRELAALPGAYAPPHGCLLLAGVAGDAIGCIALRPLPPGAAPAGDGARCGEVKRLYVRPEHRGDGWGRRLAATLLDHARASGYRELKLDTLRRMEPARALYADLGFRECGAYYDNPLPDVVYMSLSLAPA